MVNNGHCKGYVGAARIASLFLKLLPVATLRLDKIQDSQSISGQSNCAEQRYCAQSDCVKQLCKAYVQSKGIVQSNCAELRYCAQSDYAHGGGHGEG